MHTTLGGEGSTITYPAKREAKYDRLENEKCGLQYLSEEAQNNLLSIPVDKCKANYDRLNYTKCAPSIYVKKHRKQNMTDLRKKNDAPYFIPM